MQKLTSEEVLAIRRLQALAKRWPKTLQLFSRSGALCVMKPGPGLTMATGQVASILGIPNDGGDPNDSDSCDMGAVD